MKDIREIIARNICELRTDNGLTQAKLAEALNYSDKAISKWERAESMPDIVVLKMLADYFGVSIDYIISDVHSADQIKSKNVSVFRRRNRALITMLSVTLVWLIATFIFSVVLTFGRGDFLPAWMTFIYAIPVSFILLLIFNCVWGRRKFNFIIISFLIWTILLSIYLSFLTSPLGINLWLVFIMGIPAELIVFLWAGLVFGKKEE